MPSKIEWTDESWNPIAGCTKCSPGCLNCYAERMAARLTGMGVEPYHLTVTQMPKNADPIMKARSNSYKWVYEWTGDVICRENQLDKPLHWRKPRRIFVCSMSDLFHPKVGFDFRCKVFEAIANASQHTYLILTKRVEKMKMFFQLCEDWDASEWPNVHLGVSISNQAEADEKIPILLQIPAAVRWLSIEPMLGEINLNQIMIPDKAERRDGPWMLAYDVLTGERASSPYSTTQDEKIDWVVVGCESGPKRRPCKTKWIQSIAQQCKSADVPIFVKQVVNFQKNKVIKMPVGWPQEYPS